MRAPQKSEVPANEQINTQTSAYTLTVSDFHQIRYYFQPRVLCLSPTIESLDSSDVSRERSSDDHAKYGSKL